MWIKIYLKNTCKFNLIRVRIILKPNFGVLRHLFFLPRQSCWFSWLPTIMNRNRYSDYTHALATDPVALQRIIFNMLVQLTIYFLVPCGVMGVFAFFDAVNRCMVSTETRWVEMREPSKEQNLNFNRQVYRFYMTGSILTTK